MHLLRTRAWLLLVFAIASFVMLWRLDAQPIVNFDEGIHGEVSWEMLAPRSSFRSFRAKEGSPTRPAKLQRSGEGEVGVERGEWLTLSYMNGPYFRKPPVKIWMTAGLFKMLPTPRRNLADSDAGGQASNSPSSLEDSGSRFAREGERNTWIVWALRLPSAVAGILTILLTAWWMWEWRRSRWAAVLAAIIIATSPAIFEHAFRTGEMDGVLTFFTTAALYCWWRATHHLSPSHSPSPHGGEGEDQKWLILCGATIGLAVMTKSAAGLLPLPIIALDWLVRYARTIQRTVPLFHDREKGGRSALTKRAAMHPSLQGILVLVLVLVLVAAPWHLAMTLLHGTTFWNEYLGFHVVRRIMEQLHNAGAGPLWYFGAFHRIFTPWVWWLIAVLLYEFILSGARAKRRISHDGTNTPKSTAPRMGEIFRHFVPQDKLIPQDKRLRLLLLWIAVTFLTFSAAQTKFAWYLLPMLPACAMLIAWFIIEIGKYTICHDRGKLCLFLRMGFPVLVMMTIGMTAVQTYTRLAMTYQPSPFFVIADTLRTAHADGLVAYGFAWQEQPAAYFTLRTSLPQVKLSDGLTDPTRTLTKLTERDRAWLITKMTESRRPDEDVEGRDPDTVSSGLPEELRAIVGAPHQIDGWTLWPRVAPQ